MPRFSFPTQDSDLIGAHLSTKGGLPTVFGRAKKVSAASIAIFSKNSGQWNAKELLAEDCREFDAERRACGGQPLAIHASYLINLATTNGEFFRKSIDAMVVELDRASRLGAYALVLHPGAHVGQGRDRGIDQIARSLDLIHEMLSPCGVTTLLETSAGQGSCLGCTFEDLADIIRLVDDKSRVGVCIDTCHIFAAGYDIRKKVGYDETMARLEETVGIENVGAIHLNDSKKPLGSRVDRHEHIGAGEIGLDAFGFLLNDPRFTGVPKMIETPKPDPFEDDIRNLTLLRSLIGRKRKRRATRG